MLLLLGFLSCSLAAYAATAGAQRSIASCPTYVVTIEDAVAPFRVNLQPNSSYQLGSGVYILSTIVIVDADSAEW